MSLGDVASALGLAEKGLLSPESFQKIVSRVCRGTEGKSECKKSGEQVPRSVLLATIDIHFAGANNALSCTGCLVERGVRAE